MTRSAEANFNQDDDEIDLAALLNVLWRGKFWILLFAVISVGAALFYGTRIAVPMYPARATLALEVSQARVLGDIDSIFGGGGSDMATLNTEFEILTSRTLIGRLSMK